MTAPGHLIVNLLLLQRVRRPELALRLPEATIWSDAYFDPRWQRVFSSRHSFVVIGVVLIVAGVARSRWLVVLSTSMLLHAAGDLVLHHDDAHMHLYPITSWRFLSPLSYWDPAHHGGWIAAFASLVVIAAAVVLLRTTRTAVVPRAVWLALLLLMTGWTLALVFWM